jgi:hypothetical protein
MSPNAGFARYCWVCRFSPHLLYFDNPAWLWGFGRMEIIFIHDIGITDMVYLDGSSSSHRWSQISDAGSFSGYTLSKRQGESRSYRI